MYICNKLNFFFSIDMNRFYLVIIVIQFFTVNVFSQDFEVSPLKLFYTADPGESQTKFIKVKNHQSTVETFIISISDYNVDSKGKGSYVDAGSLKNSIADWLSIAPSFFELNPNEEKEIAITLQQPADNISSKWGVIFIRTAQEQTSYSADQGMAAGMTVSGRIAIHVYQTPSINKSYKATINNLNEITVKGDTARTFNVLVNNLEDRITPCKVYLIATDINTAEETMFEAQEFVLFPKSSRKLELYMTNILPKGTYSLAAVLDYGSSSNLEGTQTIIKVK